MVRAIVVTHLPSNLLLIAVALMPTLSLAVLVLLLRFSISQMDVPTRQSNTMAAVEARERSAAGGFTGVARTTGAAISPLLTGFLLARPGLINLSFYIAGTVKVVYDLLLYFSFRQLRPPEEASPDEKALWAIVVGRRIDQRATSPTARPGVNKREPGFSHG